MIRVTVAEVDRSAARQIGLNALFHNNAGVQVFAQNTGTLSTALAGAASVAASGGNLPAVIDQGQISLAIDALRNVNMVRTVAEPNLVVLNGYNARLRAGGEFPVPIITGATAVGGLSGTSFVPYGVQLEFVPVITDKNRIRLQLTAQVSVKDLAGGTTIGTSVVPGLNSRDITTTVEMREGQTLAIGGLLQTNLSSDFTRVPLFGDFPYLANLFGASHTNSGEQELVLLVTPELVHPMDPREVPPLPGCDYFEPGDWEFYLYGRIESLRPYDYRAPVMTTMHRMLAYRRSRAALLRRAAWAL